MSQEVSKDYSGLPTGWTAMLRADIEAAIAKHPELAGGDAFEKQWQAYQAAIPLLRNLANQGENVLSERSFRYGISIAAWQALGGVAPDELPLRPENVSPDLLDTILQEARGFDQDIAPELRADPAQGHLGPSAQEIADLYARLNSPNYS